MSLTISESTADGVTAQRNLASGDVVVYTARDLRRERTGMHGLVAIHFRDKQIAYDTFNIGRDPERTRLANSAWKVISSAGEVTKTLYPSDICKNDLDQLCYYLAHQWESESTHITNYNTNAPLPPVVFYLEPYIVEESGTIVFGPPGSGKSYILQAMAICVVNRIDYLFTITTERPVLWVNLERSPTSIGRRDLQLLRALSVPGKSSGVEYLHMRGQPLTAVLRKAQPWVKDNPSCVVFLDSISRTQLGSLVDDEAAMKLIDMMGGLGATWVGVAHTPRASQDHIFGSIHYEAGADIEVKLASESAHSQPTIGIALEIVKANDVPKGRRNLYALDFDQSGLAAIRKAEPSEFPELAAGGQQSPLHQIIQFLLGSPRSTQKEIAEGTGLDRANLYRYLNHPSIGKSTEQSPSGKGKPPTLYHVITH